MSLFRNGIVDHLLEINHYLLGRVREQERLLSGQEAIIKSLRKEIESWRPDRDEKGRFK